MTTCNYNNYKWTDSIKNYNTITTKGWEDLSNIEKIDYID